MKTLKKFNSLLVKGGVGLVLIAMLITTSCQQSANPSIDNFEAIELDAIAAADFDGDGIVGTSDLLILFANWGPCSQ